MTDKQVEEVDEKPPNNINLFKDVSSFSSELSKMEPLSKFPEKRSRDHKGVINYKEISESKTQDEHTQNLYGPILDMFYASDEHNICKKSPEHNEGKVLFRTLNYQSCEIPCT
jgi:hypothetical protein